MIFLNIPEIIKFNVIHLPEILEIMKITKIIEKWKDVVLHERKPLQNDAGYYFFVFWTGLEWFTAHFYTLLTSFMFFSSELEENHR